MIDLVTALALWLSGATFGTFGALSAVQLSTYREHARRRTQERDR